MLACDRKALQKQVAIMNESEYVEFYAKRQTQRGDEELRINGKPLFVPRDVFSADPDNSNSTSQMLKHLPDVSGKRVLDIGTGTGVLAIFAAIGGAREVVAVDIDPASVRNARENCESLGISDQVTVLQGDLFEPVSGQFDVVLANVPILDSAWASKGISVEDTLSRFLAGLDDHLAKDGDVLFSFASFGDPQILARAMMHSRRSWRVHREEVFGVEWQLFESCPDTQSFERAVQLADAM
jgi:release factor glutamine methyltransferase